MRKKKNNRNENLPSKGCLSKTRRQDELRAGAVSFKGCSQTAVQAEAGSQVTDKRIKPAKHHSRIKHILLRATTVLNPSCAQR